MGLPPLRHRLSNPLNNLPPLQPPHPSLIVRKPLILALPSNLLQYTPSDPRPCHERQIGIGTFVADQVLAVLEVFIED